MNDGLVAQRLLDVSRTIIKCSAAMCQAKPFGGGASESSGQAVPILANNGFT